MAATSCLRTLALLLGLAAAAHAASPVDGLEPAALWQQFGALSAIPHPSGHLDGTRDYLLNWAATAGLDSQVDDAGNVYIYRPGANGGEDAPPIVLQAHMDMVGAADDPAFDFVTTPITLIVEGDWVHANGTSLGADDAIGEAAILAVLGAAPDETSGPVSPVIGLFTVDEETSLSGAWGVNGTLLAGAQNLINLDSENLGQVCVGSAGGFQFFITTTAGLEPAAQDMQPLGLHITGLKGGHSGITINEGNGNAIKLCGAVMSQIQQEIPGACIVATDDGTAMNAIPTECKALLAVPASQVNATAALVAQAQADFLLEFGTNEPGLTIAVAPLEQLNASMAAGWEASPVCLSRRGADALIGLILNTFSGPIKYSEDLPGLVETSNALTMLTPQLASGSGSNSSAGSGGSGGTDGAFSISHTLECYPRSSIDSELPRILDQYSRLAGAFGATINNTWPFLPAWQYDPNSELTNLTVAATTEVLGSAEVAAVHAGLECAILLKVMAPASSAVSFGPTVEHVHSSEERVSISSVQAFYEILLRLLQELSLQLVNG